jgi:hypothetical protein
MMTVAVGAAGTMATVAVGAAGMMTIVVVGAVGTMMTVAVGAAGMMTTVAVGAVGTMMTAAVGATGTMAIVVVGVAAAVAATGTTMVIAAASGPEALDDRHPKPDRVWNRIPDDVRERIIRLALDEPALSPMLAVSKTLTTHTAALFCYSIVSKLYRLGTRPNHSNSEHVQLGVGADSGGGMSEDDVGF